MMTQCYALPSSAIVNFALRE